MPPPDIHHHTRPDTRPDPRAELTLAHSADADDVFMWWPITGMVDAAPPHRQIAPPVIETGRFRFRAVPEDIQVLNARAREVGDLDITALSFAAYPSVADRYALTACGSSFGEGFGPKLVARAPGMTRAELMARRPRVAVPGMQTTAVLTLSALVGPHGFEPVPMRFDEIIGAVRDGGPGAADGRRLDAGLIIHEGQLMFGQAGLVEVADLGAWWKESTGLPLPLGANAVRRDLDARFGAGALAEVVATLRRSIDFALQHRARSLEYARTFSPLKEGAEAELDRYVRMYVSGLTVEARPRGLEAVRRLLGEGVRLGLVPAIGGEGTVEMIGPPVG